MNINDMSEKEQIKEVKLSIFSFKEINNPSIAVQLAAVRKAGLAIKFISDPVEKVQLAAVKEDPSSLNFIKNPSKSSVILAIIRMIYHDYDPKVIRQTIGEHESNNWPELLAMKNSIKSDKE